MMSCSSFDKLVLISMFGSTIGGDADGDKVYAWPSRKGADGMPVEDSPSIDRVTRISMSEGYLDEDFPAGAHEDASETSALLRPANLVAGIKKSGYRSFPPPRVITTEKDYTSFEPKKNVRFVFDDEPLTHTFKLEAGTEVTIVDYVCNFQSPMKQLIGKVGKIVDGYQGLGVTETERFHRILSKTLERNWIVEFDDKLQFTHVKPELREMLERKEWRIPFFEQEMRIQPKTKQGVPLIIAAETGNLFVVEQILSNRAVDVNQSDEDGRTALHHAAATDHVEVLWRLLDHPDIQVNIKDATGATPLRLASNCGNKNAVQTLLAHENSDVKQYGLPFCIACFRCHCTNVGLFMYSAVCQYGQAAITLTFVAAVFVFFLGFITGWSVVAMLFFIVCAVLFYKASAIN